MSRKRSLRCHATNTHCIPPQALGDSASNRRSNRRRGERECEIESELLQSKQLTFRCRNPNPITCQGARTVARLMKSQLSLSVNFRGGSRPGAVKVDVLGAVVRLDEPVSSGERFNSKINILIQNDWFRTQSFASHRRLIKHEQWMVQSKSRTHTSLES